jgi:hypothetical protein
MSTKGLCVEGEVPNTAIIRGGVFGSDRIMRALTSLVDQYIDRFKN